MSEIKGTKISDLSDTGRLGIKFPTKSLDDDYGGGGYNKNNTTTTTSTADAITTTTASMTSITVSKCFK